MHKTAINLLAAVVLVMIASMSTLAQEARNFGSAATSAVVSPISNETKMVMSNNGVVYNEELGKIFLNRHLVTKGGQGKAFPVSLSVTGADNPNASVKINHLDNVTLVIRAVETSGDEYVVVITNGKLRGEFKLKPPMTQVK